MDSDNAASKKNVPLTYAEVTEAITEISKLKDEMSKLSHRLSEQRLALKTLMASAYTSIFQDQERSLLSDYESRPTKDEDENTELLVERKQTLSDIAKEIEGYKNLTENSDRYFLYKGDLTELDAIDNSQIRRLRAYLFSDVLLLTSTITNRRTPAQYKFETSYGSNNLTTVDVEDVKNAFKLWTSHETRVFQASSLQAKKEWLEKFEEAGIRHRSSPDRKRRVFDKFEDDVNELPDWLSEVAEDLDGLIIEQRFEDASSLILKTRNYFKESPPSNEVIVQDILGQVDVRARSLYEILIKKLEVMCARSYQNNLRVARRAIRLLNTLQKSTQACDMFLKICSNILKTRLERAKKETLTTVNVRQLSAVFFSHLCDMTGEFYYKAFPDNPYLASTFVVWCIKEVSNFMDQLIRLVFVHKVSIPVLSKFVEHLRIDSKPLAEFGMDVVTDQIERQLITPFNQVLLERKDKLIQIINEKAADEKWQSTNLKTKLQAGELISEFNELGIVGVEKYITDDFRSELSNNILWLARTCAQLMQNSSFIGPNILHNIEPIICDIITHYIDHVVNALRSEKFQAEKPAIETNVQFLAENFIPSCEVLYEKYFGMPSMRLIRMRKELKI